MPQIPTPFTSKKVTLYIRSSTSENASRNPAHQPFPNRRVKTMEPILSVTDPNV